MATAKLSKLELPTFEGDIKLWQGFWEQFSVSIDNVADIPEVTKFTYLRSLLKGEPLKAVSGLSMCEKHYSIACAILKERYGRKETIIFAHIQELMNISPPTTRSKISHLRNFQDKLLSHIRSLEVLGVSGSQYGVILTPMILAKLPSDIRLEWAREGAGREDDLDFLLTFLNLEIQRRERSQNFKISDTLVEE